MWDIEREEEAGVYSFIVRWLVDRGVSFGLMYVAPSGLNECSGPILQLGACVLCKEDRRSKLRFSYVT